MSFRLFFELGLVAVILVLLFALWRTSKNDKFEDLHNFATGVFHSVAAVALVLTGVWVIVQEDWAPKTSMELVTSAAPLHGSKPKSALLQAAISMKNEGRLPHRFEQTTFVVRAYDPAAQGPDEYGDVAHRVIDEYPSKIRIKVMPGETEKSYAEFVVPCSENVVQLFVDVAQPKHMTQNSKRPLSYERKAVVPLSEACK